MPPSLPAQSSPAPLERVASIVAGTALLLPLLHRRSLWRYGTAAAGGALIYNGINGRVNITGHLASRTQLASQRIHQSITIGRSATELSSMWRNPDVIARVMQPIGEVEILGTDHLRWTLSVLNKKLAVECVLANERPGELVHWTSMPTAGFKFDEYMRFKPAPQGRGTEATLAYRLEPSGTPAGATLRYLASFLEGPARTAIRKVLHNFKSLAETGEIATLERNPSARNNGKSNGDLI